MHKLRVYVYDLPWTVRCHVKCGIRKCSSVGACSICFGMACSCAVQRHLQLPAQHSLLPAFTQVAYQPAYYLGWTDHDQNYLAWKVFGQMFMNDTVVRYVPGNALP